MYCTTLDDRFTGPLSLLPTASAATPFPSTSIQRLVGFQGQGPIDMMSRVQITRTSLWLNWPAHSSGKHGLCSLSSHYSSPHCRFISFVLQNLQVHSCITLTLQSKYGLIAIPRRPQTPSSLIFVAMTASISHFSAQMVLCNINCVSAVQSERVIFILGCNCEPASLAATTGNAQRFNHNCPTA